MKMIVIGSPNFIIIKIFISAPLMCLQSPGECCVCMYVCLCMPTSLAVFTFKIFVSGSVVFFALDSVLLQQRLQSSAVNLDSKVLNE